MCYILPLWNIVSEWVVVGELYHLDNCAVFYPYVKSGDDGIKLVSREEDWKILDSIDQ
jgi:hypothetical protein